VGILAVGIIAITQESAEEEASTTYFAPSYIVDLNTTKEVPLDVDELLNCRVTVFAVGLGGEDRG
jgi:hypothetical protein